MNLFDHPNVFRKLILDVVRTSGITYTMVEKDYYIFFLLRKLMGLDPLLVFKGGTSLSKCFKCIHRFSEDIDLSLEGARGPVIPPSKNEARIINKAIREVCSNSGFGVMRNQNSDKPFYSVTKFHGFYIDYPSLFSTDR